MTTPLAHEARITALEYAVFEQFPHTLEAMLHPLTRANAIATENAQAIAGLRVDTASLKAALDLQGDGLRNELAVATSEFRTGLTGVREEISLRFQKVDGQFNGVHGNIANLQADVTGLKEDMTGLKEDVTGLNDKLDTLIDEIRNGKD